VGAQRIAVLLMGTMPPGVLGECAHYSIEAIKQPTEILYLLRSYEAMHHIYR